MTQSKFDLQNLPDLKIRVANADESERAQLAFFALNAKWHFDGCKQAKFLDHKFLAFRSLPNNSENLLSKIRDVYEFKKSDYQEITLPELEAIAAEKQKNE
jgi:hypothetical protein